MSVKESNGKFKVIPITEESLERMPKPFARRMRPGLRPEVYPEFEEWIEDMGYGHFVESKVIRQLLFESFVGGWGAKIRQLKRRKANQ